MVQPAVRHLSTYVKMFVLIPSLRKPMLTSWHFGAGQDILGQKNTFFNEKSLKTGKVICEFVTEQGIVSHLDISNVDIIYKVRLFVTNKKKWKSDFGLLWRY